MKFTVFTLMLSMVSFSALAQMKPVSSSPDQDSSLVTVSYISSSSSSGAKVTSCDIAGHYPICRDSRGNVTMVELLINRAQGQSFAYSYALPDAPNDGIKDVLRFHGSWYRADDGVNIQAYCMTSIVLKVIATNSTSTPVYKSTSTYRKDGSKLIVDVENQDKRDILNLTKYQIICSRE